MRTHEADASGLECPGGPSRREGRVETHRADVPRLEYPGGPSHGVGELVVIVSDEEPCREELDLLASLDGVSSRRCQDKIHEKRGKV